MSELSHHEPNILSRKFIQFDLDGKSLFRKQTNYVLCTHVEIEVADDLVTATSAGPCATLCGVPLVPPLYCSLVHPSLFGINKSCLKRSLGQSLRQNLPHCSTRRGRRFLRRCW